MKPKMEKSAFEAAVKLLAGREHAKAELFKKLSERKYAVEEIDEALEKLEQLHYLDDARFASLFVKERVNLRHFGLESAKRHLREAGVSASDIEAGIFAIEEELDEQAACERAARKKARQLAREPERKKRILKMKRFLASRGFPFEMINIVVDSIYRHNEDEP